MQSKMILEKIKPEKMGDFDRVLDDFLPYLSLNSDQIDDIVNWENGKSYQVCFQIRQDGTRRDKVTGVVSADFKITAYNVMKQKDITEMDDKEFSDYQSEELAKVSTNRASSPSINLENR